MPIPFGARNQYPIGVLNRQLGMGLGVDVLWEWGVRPGVLFGHQMPASLG